MADKQTPPATEATISGVVSASTWTPTGAAMLDVPSEGQISNLKSQISNKEMSLGQTAAEWVSGWGSGQARNYGGPTRPATQSIWPYACISAIAGAVSSVPLMASKSEAAGTRGLWNLRHVRAGRRGGRKYAGRKSQTSNVKSTPQKAVDGEIVENGPLVELLAEPMPGLTQREWVRRIVGYLYGTGRVHILKAECVGARPTMLVPIPGSATKPIYEKTREYKRVIGWDLAAPNDEHYFVPDELMVTLTLFDPYNPDTGLAPHDPATMSIAADYNAAKHIAASFANGCEPGGIMKIDGPYSAETDQQIRRAWNQRHQGAGNARKLAILFGNAKYETVAQSMIDMGLATVKQGSREEVCAAYRVPPSVAGFFGTAGDASAYVEAEQQRFWQDTAGIVIENIAAAINMGVAPLVENGLEVWADLEDVPVYQAMRQKNMKAVGELWSKGVPLSDLSDMLDLGLPERPQHAIGYLPAGLVPATAIAEPEDPGEIDPPEGSDSVGQGGERNLNPQTVPAGNLKSRISNQQKGPSAYDVLAASLWKAWTASWRPLAKAAENMFRSHFSTQQRKIVAGLKNAMLVVGPQSLAGGGERYLKSEILNQKNPDVVARVLFDVLASREARAALQARVRVFLADARELGIRQALTEAGLTGDALAEAMRQMTADPAIVEGLLADQVRVTTLVNERTRTLLRRELLDGLDAGEGIREMASRVQGVMQNRRNHAHMIARNTVAQANSHARHVGRQSYATHEIWVSSRGPGERRENHIAAEVFYRQNPKPIGESWEIGGAKLRYPRDPAGPPGEIINCQCLAIGKRLAAKGGGQISNLKSCLPAGRSQIPDATDLLAAQATEGFVNAREVAGLLREESGEENATE